jgi:hypothetical protein
MLLKVVLAGYAHGVVSSRFGCLSRTPVCCDEWHTAPTHFGKRSGASQPRRSSPPIYASLKV